MTSPIGTTYRRHEQAKGREYEQRVREIERASFPPRVFSAAGGMAPQARVFYKKLSDLLAVERKDKYSRMIAPVRVTLNFSLLRDAIASLHSARPAKGCFGRFFLLYFSYVLRVELSKELYEAMTFPTPDQSVRLLQSMCDKFPSLYRHSLQDPPEKPVLLILETGDNFRGADRRKIEQDSFSILNIKSLITSPPGQFVNGLWRGPESRKYLKGHLSGTYQDLDDCVRNGLAVTLPDGRLEIFNVVVFYVADLAH